MRLSKKHFNGGPVVLTLVQQRAIQFAMADGGELQIGGMCGRPVRRDVAARLVELGIFEYVQAPTSCINWWKYRLNPGALAKAHFGKQ